MEPVDQRRLGEDKGDCFFACLASITGIPLEEFDLAYEMGPYHWWSESLAVLQEYGWQMVYCTTERTQGGEHMPDVDRLDLAPPGYHVAGGGSPRGAWNRDHPGHCVVYLDGEPVHDPHPSREGLSGPPTEFYILIPPRRP